MTRAIPAWCAAIALCVVGASTAAAQDHVPAVAPERAPQAVEAEFAPPDQPSSPATPESIDRIREALNRQPLVTTGTPLFEQQSHDESHFGFLTFVTPDTRGEFVRIRVPIGELVMDAVHSVSSYQHRRAEKAAHDEVAKALAEFLQANPTK